ncbi:MAG: integrin alpha [Planctomycetota bacterium]
MALIRSTSAAALVLSLAGTAYGTFEFTGTLPNAVGQSDSLSAPAGSSPGVPVDGTTLPGTWDLWTFQAGAGEPIVIDVQSSGGEVVASPKMAVFLGDLSFFNAPPDGTDVADARGQGRAIAVGLADPNELTLLDDATVTFTAPRTGTYSVLVASQELDASIESYPYTITLNPPVSVGPDDPVVTQLLTNGDFETGTLIGWTLFEQDGSAGDLFATDLAPGATLPLSGDSAAGPSAGAYYAAVDQSSPGAYALTQSFTVSSQATDVALTFDFYNGDTSGSAPQNSGVIDFDGGPTQWARIDILDENGIVLGTFGDAPATFTYTSFEEDITSLVEGGGTFTLRYGHVDNAGFFHSALDNVAITQTIQFVPPVIEAINIDSLVNVNPVTGTFAVGESENDPESWDVYSFDVDSGDRIRFYVRPESSLLVPTVALYEEDLGDGSFPVPPPGTTIDSIPNAYLVSTGDSGLPSLFDAEATDPADTITPYEISGTYSLVVANTTPLTLGPADYQLGVEVLSDAERFAPYSADFSGSAPGFVLVESFDDFADSMNPHTFALYTFSVNKGDNVTIDLSRLDSPFDPSLAPFVAEAAIYEEDLEGLSPFDGDTVTYTAGLSPADSTTTTIPVGGSVQTVFSFEATKTGVCSLLLAPDAYSSNGPVQFVVDVIISQPSFYQSLGDTTPQYSRDDSVVTVIETGSFQPTDTVDDPGTWDLYTFEALEGGEYVVQVLRGVQEDGPGMFTGADDPSFAPAFAVYQGDFSGLAVDAPSTSLSAAQGLAPVASGNTPVSVISPLQPVFSGNQGPSDVFVAPRAGTYSILIAREDSTASTANYALLVQTEFSPLSVFGPTFDVASLLSENSGDGTDGFVLRPGPLSLDLGSSVSNAGDINGDGIDDVLVGDRDADSLTTEPDAGGDPYPFGGAAYVLFGRPVLNEESFPAELQVSSISSPIGFSFMGDASQQRVGWSLDAAGDVNGDGKDDVIIGAPGAESANGIVGYAGAAYVLYGRAEGNAFPDVLSPIDVDSATGVIIEGTDPDQAAGIAVAGLGNFNGDGFDDVAVTAFDGFFDTSGQSTSFLQNFVVFGSDTLAASSPVQLAGFDGTDGFAVDPIDIEYDVSFSYDSSTLAAGDINGDGFQDLAIQPVATDFYGQSGPYSELVVPILFGDQPPFPTLVGEGSLNGEDGFAFVADEDDYDSSIPAVSSAGDFNGDGIDDLLLADANSTPDAPAGRTSAGQLLLYFGGSIPDLPAQLDLDTIQAPTAIGFLGAGFYDFAGSDIASAGDVNGDGFDDIIIGAYGYDGEIGETRVYLVFGGPSIIDAAQNAPNESFDLGQLLPENGGDGSLGVVLTGFREDDGFELRIDGVGDVNNDGFDDIIVGNYDRTGGGIAYVIFGRPSIEPPILQGDFVLPTTIDSFDLASFMSYVAMGHPIADIPGAHDGNTDGLTDGVINADDVIKYIELILGD